jgi:hypothetical protein
MDEGGGARWPAGLRRDEGPQVHLSGFTVKGHHVEQLSEADAKRRRLGRVRGILFIDRNNAEALRAAVKDIIAEMK